jgi:hypothetical protein
MYEDVNECYPINVQLKYAYPNDWKPMAVCIFRYINEYRDTFLFSYLPYLEDTDIYIAHTNTK